jgi:signal transduction histidine kinase
MAKRSTIKMESMKQEIPDLGSSVNLERLPGEVETMEIGGTEVRVDEEKVSRIQESLDTKREELRTKLYAVSMNSETFEQYADFIRNNSEWNSTEALGIIEINKALSRIEKEGIKDNMIYLNSLTLEASHYFVSKSKGRGIGDAQNFIKIYKPLDIALGDVKNDSMEIRDLEKELAAAQQGLTLA